MFRLARLILHHVNNGYAGETDETRQSASLASTISGRVARGYSIPRDALDPIEPQAQLRLAQRDLTTLESTEGGYLVVPGTVVGAPQPVLRPRRWTEAVGVQRIDGLQGDGEVVVPIHAGASTGGWIPRDGEAGGQSDEDVANVSFYPRTVTAWTRLSRGIIQQAAASIDVENWVRAQLRESLDDAIDRAVLRGSGLDGEPMGLLATPGVSAVNFASAADPKVPTRDELVDLFATPAKADANPAAVQFVGGSELAQTMRKTEVSAGSGRYVLDCNPGSGMPEIAGVAPYHETTHVPDDTAAVGDWRHCVVGEWSDPLDLIVDPFSHASDGRVRVVVFATVDVAFAQRAAFAIGR